MSFLSRLFSRSSLPSVKSQHATKKHATAYVSDGSGALREIINAGWLCTCDGRPARVTGYDQTESGYTSGYRLHITFED